MLLRILLACLVLGGHLCPVLAARLCGEESRHECQRGQPSQGCYGCVFRQGSHLPSTLREVPAQQRPPAVELPGDLRGAGGAGRGLEGACATWARGGLCSLHHVPRARAAGVFLPHPCRHRWPAQHLQADGSRFRWAGEPCLVLSEQCPRGVPLIWHFVSSRLCR